MTLVLALIFILYVIVNLNVPNITLDYLQYKIEVQK